jgi:hypothetical protein
MLGWWFKMTLNNRQQLPLYRVRGQGKYKEEGSSDQGVMSLREGPS